MGVYHDVKKVDGKFQLTRTRPAWKFWQSGDQDFLARPGDKLYFYTRVFSPGDFATKLNIRWLRYEKNGWQAWDAIPLPITGGREEGFRAHAVKSNYAPGEWRVQVETEDGREMGRLYFTILEDAGTEERELQVEEE